MIQLDSSQGYVAVFAIALVFGILGGLAAEFLLNRNGETGTFELPRRDGRLFDFGGFANLFVGGVTGMAILLVFPPSSVTIQGAGGAGATVVSGYDPIRLAVTALVAGSAGGSVLTSLQARIGAALSEAKVQLTKQTGQLEIDRLGDESTRAATEALRALAAASPTPAAMSTPRRRRPGAAMDVPPMAPVGDALDDAIASVKLKLSPEEIESALESLGGWQIVDGKLHREYRFRDFVEAWGFMARVALLAEKQDHHP